LLNRTIVMDVLSDILGKIKLSSAVYFKSDFSSPWGMDIPKGPFAQFHIVTEGECILNTRTRKLQLFAGDIIVFPLGTSHWLADVESSDRKEGIEVVNAILNGKSLFDGDQIATTLVCGHFAFDKSIDHPFLSQLPDLIYIPNTEKQEHSWLESISNLVIQEAEKEQSGSNVIVNKLGEVLFVHALRAYIQKNKVKKGFFAALQDKRISKALKVIHNSPEKDWQVHTLAKTAGMSRTSFSNRFRELIEDTPMSYLTQWRILQAQELLKETEKPVGEIAEEVGYLSEAAFSRVFKKRVAQTPLKYRKGEILT